MAPAQVVRVDVMKSEALRMRCPCCRQTIEPGRAWKGSDNHFYCSEFCADSEDIAAPSSPPSKDQIDRAYLNRLERLLPLLQTARQDSLPR
jgi:hypothetical protein